MEVTGGEVSSVSCWIQRTNRSLARGRGHCSHAFVALPVLQLFARMNSASGTY